MLSALLEVHGCLSQLLYLALIGTDVFLELVDCFAVHPGHLFPFFLVSLEAFELTLHFLLQIFIFVSDLCELAISFLQLLLKLLVRLLQSSIRALQPGQLLSVLLYLRLQL